MICATARVATHADHESRTTRQSVRIVRIHVLSHRAWQPWVHGSIHSAHSLRQLSLVGPSDKAVEAEKTGATWRDKTMKSCYASPSPTSIQTRACRRAFGLRAASWMSHAAFKPFRRTHGHSVVERRVGSIGVLHDLVDGATAEP